MFWQEKEKGRKYVEWFTNYYWLGSSNPLNVFTRSTTKQAWPAYAAPWSCPHDARSWSLFIPVAKLLRLYPMERNKGMSISHPGPEMLEAAFCWTLFSVHRRLYTQNYFAALVSVLQAYHDSSFLFPEDASPQFCHGVSSGDRHYLLWVISSSWQGWRTAPISFYGLHTQR